LNPTDEEVYVDEVSARRELEVLRTSIDNLDAALVHLLAERFKCTERVGQLKAAAGLPPADPAREEYQIQRLRGLATSSGLNPRFAEKILGLIIDEVIRNHESLRSAASPSP
jgi:chorismate mutase